MTLLLLTLLLSLPASAEPPPVGFEQKLGATVRGDLQLMDEQGQGTAFKDLLDGRPTLLVLGYYGCPMLCHQVQSGLVDSLQLLEWSAGREFNVLTVSIDARERPKLARRKKHAYLSRYDRPQAETGWRFLTGADGQLKELQRAVGFSATYDPDTDQFAHAAGLVVLTPEGTVSSYLMGISFPARALKLALQRASSGTVGSPVDQILLLCYQYDPSTGRYSLAITRIVQLAGIGSALLLAAWLIWAHRRHP